MKANCQDHKTCIDEALAKAEIICRDKNLLLTNLRQKILRLVWQEGHTAVKAYDLLKTLQEEMPSAKPITIYRALDFLVENHIIHKLASKNSFIGCDHPEFLHNCAFLICKECNEVKEFCNKVTLIDSLTSIIDPKLFHIETVTLEVHGICHKCNM